MKGLQDKVAIITGGATLIGAGVARASWPARARGHPDIDAAGGERVAAELGERCRFLRTDISDDARVAAAVAQVAEQFGGVDFLVNPPAPILMTGCAPAAPTGAPPSTSTWSPR